MALPDYYMILGVPRNALPEEIKKAYKEKALQYHPDVSTSEYSVEIFQLINTAYHTLIDPALRRQYDLKLKFPEYFSEKKTSRHRPAADARYYQRAEHKAPVYPKHFARNIRWLNSVMLYSIIALLCFGIVMGTIDLIINYDFTGLLVSVITLAIIITGVRIIRHQKYHKNKF